MSAAMLKEENHLPSHMAKGIFWGQAKKNRKNRKDDQLLGIYR